MSNTKVTDEKALRKILSGIVTYSLPRGPVRRRQDDTDGSHAPKHGLTVAQGPDGDMFIWQGLDFHSNPGLRFRTFAGGGGSLATHNALRILALAFTMDGEYRPQKPDAADSRPHEMSLGELYAENQRLREENARLHQGKSCGN